jgi:multiple sugar transport system substrate-binding protein
MQSKIRRKLSLFFAYGVVMAAGMLAACSRPAVVEPATDEPLFAGQSVKVVSPSETVTSLIKRYTRGWEKKVGAHVEIVPTPSNGDLTKVADASVWVVRTAEMPRWAAAGLLNPVPNAYRAANGDYGWSGLLPIYREKLLRWAGEVYALPLLGDAPVCFYRADLFADPSHQKAYHEKYHHDLGPPHTWDEFADIAEYFSTNRTANQPKPSLPPLPDSAEDVDALFQMIAAPHTRRETYQEGGRPVPDEELFSHHFHLKSGQPRIDQPGFVRALQLLQRMQHFRPQGSSAEPSQAFVNGSAVLCVTEASWLQRFRAGLSPAALGICEVPGSSRWFRFRNGEEMPAPREGNHIPYQGAHGWLALVPRSAPHAEAAFALCAHLSDRTTGTQIAFEPSWGGGAYRLDHLTGSQNWFSFELDESRTRQLRDATQQALNRPGLMNPVVRLRIPDQHLYQEVLVEQIRLGLAKDTDAQQTLQEVARRWNSLDEAKDKKKRIDEYRISLGLSALP